MELNALPIYEYTKLLEEKKSVPGGGSCLGLVLELACSLGMMVLNFTIDKKGYENVYEEAKILLNDLNKIKKKAHLIINEDGEAYRKVMEAYRLKDEKRISEASIVGCEVPYQLYLLTKECENILLRVNLIGNKNLLSDAEIGIDLCRSIYHGAKLNIKCNVNGITDLAIKEKYLQILK